jgi:hypothetical protein
MCIEARGMGDTVKVQVSTDLKQSINRRELVYSWRK